MICRAATCDRDQCEAVLIEPRTCQISFEPCDGCEYCERPLEGHMAWYGWITDETGHTCPACDAGRGPVLELGDCPACSGRTVDSAAGARCHYCRNLTPHRDDLDDAAWDGRGVINTPNGPAVGGDDWS